MQNNEREMKLQSHSKEIVDALQIELSAANAKVIDLEEHTRESDTLLKEYNIINSIVNSCVERI